MSKLKMALTNEIRIKVHYEKYNNNNRFIIIKRILKNLKEESIILAKNYKIIKNASLSNFEIFKNEKKTKFSCIYCGEQLQNNFELSVHDKSKQCVQDREQTCSFCLKLNTKDHRSKNHRPIECVVCGVGVKGIIYHLLSVDHTNMYTPHITQQPD
jgi:hypothetical protein